jgi:radical SAM protein with 4Fe4S-binding SPASM domain
MCGRRKIDKYYPKIAMNYGDMDTNLLMKIASELPKTGLVIQLHNNGEPLLYKPLHFALQLFRGHIRCFDTNGKLLLERANDIIDNMETITISVIENDPEGDEQYEIVKSFLELKGDNKPNVIYRCLGDVDTKRWKKLPGIVATRILHHPLGNFQYPKKNPTIPEIGICLDLLHHLVIDRFGNVYPCVRFDPKREQCIGNAYDTPLLDIWNGKNRKDMIKRHIQGIRSDPICKNCKFWGVPTG